MFPGRFAVISLLVAFFFLPISFCDETESSENPGDTIMSGTWEVEYLITDPSEMLVPIACKTASYSQTVQRIHRGYRIIVTCQLHPIILDDSLINWPALEHVKDPKLQKSLEIPMSRNDAVRTVLAWLDSTITYKDNPHQNQTVETAVTSGSANCVGRSKTAAAILNDIGITTRMVSGCLYKNGDTVFHRWLEIEYPDAGALPSEPGSTMDYVSPSHLLILPSDKAPLNINRLSSLGVVIRKIREERFCWPIDKKPGPPGYSNAIQRRQTTSQRYNTAITGIISPVADQTTITLNNGSKRWTLVADQFGCFAMNPLSPGLYEIVVQAPGYRVLSREMEIQPREHIQLHFTLDK